MFKINPLYSMFPNTSLRTQFNWTHYITFISIENQDKREFYLAEAKKNNRSAGQLEKYYVFLSGLFKKLPAAIFGLMIFMTGE